MFIILLEFTVLYFLRIDKPRFLIKINAELLHRRLIFVLYNVIQKVFSISADHLGCGLSIHFRDVFIQEISYGVNVLRCGFSGDEIGKIGSNIFFVRSTSVHGKN
jgi:hypothetical protein